MTEGRVQVSDLLSGRINRNQANRLRNKCQNGSVKKLDFTVSTDLCTESRSSRVKWLLILWRADESDQSSWVRAGGEGTDQTELTDGEVHVTSLEKSGLLMEQWWHGGAVGGAVASWFESFCVGFLWVPNMSVTGCWSLYETSSPLGLAPAAPWPFKDKWCRWYRGILQL